MGSSLAAFIAGNMPKIIPTMQENPNAIRIAQPGMEVLFRSGFALVIPIIISSAIPIPIKPPNRQKSSRNTRKKPFRVHFTKVGNDMFAIVARPSLAAFTRDMGWKPVPQIAKPLYLQR